MVTIFTDSNYVIITSLSYPPPDWSTGASLRCVAIGAESVFKQEIYSGVIMHTREKGRERGRERGFNCFPHTQISQGRVVGEVAARVTFLSWCGAVIIGV